MSSDILFEMGRKLATLRKRAFPKDNQGTFAVRIGVSKSTYVKMEQGDSQVAIGSYFKAASILNAEAQFGSLFTAPKEEINLFELSGHNKTKKPKS